MCLLRRARDAGKPLILNIVQQTTVVRFSLRESSYLSDRSRCSESRWPASGLTVAFKTTFEVFTRVGPDNSLERLTERSVRLVTDRPSDVRSEEHTSELQSLRHLVC